MEQKSCIFLPCQKIHLYHSNQKNIFFVKSSCFINCFAKMFLQKNVFIDDDIMVSIWHCFRTVNFLDFMKKLKRKWTIFIVSKWGCNSQCKNLINSNKFFQKLSCKIINTTRTFHHKNIFLKRDVENTRLLYVDFKYSRGQKKRRIFWNFFWNGHNFVSFWDWVENVVSFES